MVEIPESDAIETYLAQKFQLLGQDTWDEIKIRAFAASCQAVNTFYFLRVATVRDQPEYKAIMMARFLNEAVTKFVEVHEMHLNANQNNGHYVGDKVRKKQATTNKKKNAKKIHLQKTDGFVCLCVSLFCSCLWQI